MISLLLDFLSAYRLTRLITADTILDGPRDALVYRAYNAQAKPKGRIPGVLAEEEGIELLLPGGWSELAQVDPHAPKLATLVTCAYCAGVWVSFGIVIVRRFRWWQPMRDGLALSAAAVMLKRLEP